MGKWRETKRNRQIDHAAKWYTFAAVLFILHPWLIGIFFFNFFLGSAGPLLLCVGSRVSGSVIVVDGLSCSMARGIFQDQGSHFVSPALTGRFLTTGPPGES